MERKLEKVATNVVLPRIHKDMLKLLAKKTRITQSEFLREAVADLLEKYSEYFKGTAFAASSGKGSRKGRRA